MGTPSPPPAQATGTSRTPASRHRTLQGRQRQERNRQHAISPVKPYSSARAGPVPLSDRPATASRVSSRHGIIRIPTTTRTISDGDGFMHPIPGQMVRRQSAPVQLHGREVILDIASESIPPMLRPPAAPSQIPAWHRTSSPIPRKLGNTTFQYKTLAENEIRLLQILPDTSTILKCEILHTSLGDPQKYTAISYAWGDPDDTRCIILDGQSFPVTESLWQALQRLRSRTTSVVVWADAVCIDQRNTAERNSQVQLMTSIYANAHDMAIWLGPESEESSLAVTLLHEIVSAQNSFVEIRNIIKSPVWRPYFRALVALFNRDYWKRLWVVQEVINSRAITVHCGASAIPWRTYTMASYIFSELKADLIHAFMRLSYSEGLGGNLPWETFLCRRGPAGLRNMDFSHLGPGGLLQALLHYRSKLCAEPRDRVYGILGILSPQERAEFPVEYSISTIEIYTNVVDYILKTTHRLDIICASIHYPKHRMIERLPSWVPDWSYYPAMGPLTLQHNSRYHASDQVHRTDADFFFSRRRRELTIKAIPISEIKTCGVQVGVPINMDAILMTFFQWRLELIKTQGELDLPADESFCRTLCLDALPLIEQWTSEELVHLTYHIFATLLRERLPGLQLDAQLQHYASKPYIPTKSYITPEFRQEKFSDIFAGTIPGRRFAITRSGLMCLGSGALHGDDIICVPLGCSTPVILRKHGEGYLFVGDVYVDGYMYGKAMDEMGQGIRQLETFVLH